ncbi:Zn-dependent alcohol dehydrogenase (fragment) [Hyella patelloides LEGE 07179]|uniref:Zn-dependent alcohol dehydrogenase n=1 Tax=Hyella patelloides LEGE 07179 TaxID=945734 RepID=A0A563VWB7_9CYAN
MSTFTAYAALQPKAKLQQWQYETAPLKNDEIEVWVTHNGLCHTDIHMRDNDWGVSKFPLVAVHEVVGVVTEVGKDVANLQTRRKAKEAVTSVPNCL